MALYKEGKDHTLAFPTRFRGRQEETMLHELLYSVGTARGVDATFLQG